MSVQKKSLISNTAVKKTQIASQEQPQSNELKASSLAAHSMKKKKGNAPFAAMNFRKV